MHWILMVGYGAALFFICAFSIGQANLAIHYLRRRKATVPPPTPPEWPHVTVQLPVYNEQYVIGRLIDAVVAIDYPADRLEIQVLDDSTDETVGIIAQKSAHYQAQGVDIRHVRRTKRSGYKAGALQYGLAQGKGEIMAIFDADFLPDKNFLKAVVPHFSDPSIGMVQTRWTHINEGYNLLTRLQAFALNAHFTIDQSGRQAAGSFINFNGTGGAWRKSCIEDAGGWHYDTLSEDLDLSYRAQLRGWRFHYLEADCSPAELPVLMPAIKSQQYRWNKGAAETARKHLVQVLGSSLAPATKLRAAMHLLNSSVFVLLFIAAMISVPLLSIKASNPSLQLFFHLGSVFILGFLAIGMYYWVSSRALHPHHTFGYFIWRFPLFLALSMGLSLHNSIAVVEGFLEIRTPFVRTPKFNITSANGSWRGKHYLEKKWSPIVLMEGLLALYFGYGIYLGLRLADYGLMGFHLMLALGFGYVCIVSLKPLGHAD